MGIRDLQLNKVSTATKSQLDKVRYPELIFTDGYLNDEIRYIPDQRFVPAVTPLQISIPNQIERDYGDYLQVDSNNDNPQILSVNMFSRVVNRTSYTKVMKNRIQFTEFGVSE